MRSKKIQGQALFDIEKKSVGHGLRARENGKRSPTKSKLMFYSFAISLLSSILNFKCSCSQIQSCVFQGIGIFTNFVYILKCGGFNPIVPFFVNFHP